MDDKEFMRRMRNELKRAREKHPEADARLPALMEEVGEVSKAVLEEPWNRVIDEAVQVAVTAMRLAVEGDPTMRYWRSRKVHAFGTQWMKEEHLMPVGLSEVEEYSKEIPESLEPENHGIEDV